MIHNIADVIPAGVAVPLASSRRMCNWLQIIAPTGNAAAIRIGDVNTGAGSGLSIPAGGGMLFPPISDDLYIDLAMIYVYATTTDRVSAIYGTH